jgi:ribose transport system substrate-binding protein
MARRRVPNRVTTRLGYQMKIGIVAAAVCLLAAACGSSSSSSGTADSTSSASTKEAVAAAKKALDTFLAPPMVTVPPLSSKPPSGKTIEAVTCSVPACVATAQQAVIAGKALGWKVNIIYGGVTPQSYLSALDQAVAHPGSGVMYNAILPDTAITRQLAELRTKHIPFVSLGEPFKSSTYGTLADFLGPSQVAPGGRVMADWVIVNSDGNPGKVAYFWDPALPQHRSALTAFQAILAKACSSRCPVDVQTASATTFGTTFPQRVVSFLEENPTVKYVVFGYAGGQAVGVPQALKAAGLAGKVQIVQRQGDPFDLGLIKSGQEAMAEFEEVYEVGWEAINAFARYFVGDSDSQYTDAVGLWYHAITKQNLPNNISVFYSAPGFQSKYLAAWKVSS